MVTYNTGIRNMAYIFFEIPGTGFDLRLDD